MIIKKKELGLIFILSVIFSSIFYLFSTKITFPKENLKLYNAELNEGKISASAGWEYTTTGFKDIDITPDGQYIATALHHNITFFDNSTNIPLWLYNTSDWVESVSITDDGNYIVGGGWNQTVYYFSKSSAMPIWSINMNNSVESVDISGDGNYIVVTCGGIGGGIYLLDNDRNVIWKNLTMGGLDNAIISYDGSMISATRGFLNGFLFQRTSSEPILTIPGGNYGIDIALSKDGKYALFSVLDHTSYISLYDTSIVSMIWNYSIDYDGASIDISDDGDNIIVKGPNKLLLFNRWSSTPIKNFTFNDYLYGIAISGDGNRIAVGCNDENVYYFDFSQSNYIWRYNIKTAPERIAISSNGKYIYVANYGKIRYLIDGNLPQEINLNTDAGSPETDGCFNLNWDNSFTADYYNVYVHNSTITNINNSVELRYAGISYMTILIEEFITDTYYYIIIGFNGNGNISSNCISVVVSVSSGSFGPFILTSNALNPDTDGEFTLDWEGFHEAKNFSIYSDNKNITTISGSEDLIASGHKNTFISVSIYTSGIYFYIIAGYYLNGSRILSNCINVTVHIYTNGTYHIPSYIVDNTGGGDSTWSQLTNNPWCSGSGTYDDPYIISYISVDGGNSGSCFNIQHSNDYFIITNSTFFNSGSGLYDSGILLDNVTNGQLILNNCSNNNGYGISLLDSNNNSLEYNTLQHNNYSGIYIDPSYNITLSHNFALANDYYGIYLQDSSDINLTQNFANYNDYDGFFLENCSKVCIKGNIINNNLRYGIGLELSHKNEILGNNINNNLVGINFISSDNNDVLGNVLTGNEEGIYQDPECDGNTFIGNQDDSVSTKDDTSIDGKEDFPLIIIIILIMVIGSLIGISLVGITRVKKSNVKLREKEIEIRELIKHKEGITENDIVVSKEQHFCLVHKGPIKGFNFICPECGTYYCLKCLEALKEIENTCWSCGKALDPSKPIKKTQEKDEIESILDEDSNQIEIRK